MRQFPARLILFIAALISTRPVLADAALMIFPTLVMFDDGRSSAEVTVSNRGDEAGTFEIGWADMSMTREGGLIRHEESMPWSVQPFVRYSPRRVTLAPAESQVVKIALRRGDSIAEGEYYSHMRVVTINSAPPDSDAAGTPAPSSGVSITARTAIAIPVVWRNSRSVPAAAIDALDLDSAARTIRVHVRRDGLLSVRGFLHVVNLEERGASAIFSDPVPLIMYPTVDNREATVQLTEGVSLADLPPTAEVVFAADDTLTDRSKIYSTRRVFPTQ